MMDCGSGVRHFGQTSPASSGTTTVAQAGHEKVAGTGRFGGNYMTSGLLYFVERS